MASGKPHKGAGHRKRLRDKFLASGLSGFHDYEVVELLLTLGTPVKDCKDAAKEALSAFRSLQGVMNASVEELCSIKGIGPKNVFGIKLVKEAADRYLAKSIEQRPVVSSSGDLLRYLNHTLRDRHREAFTVIFLDAKNRVIASETLFEGSLTESPVYTREVVKRALDHRAAAIICCHNHPSGDPEPSRQDVLITRKLVMACRAMGISVHDHIIVGERGHYSFADSGRMALINSQVREMEDSLSRVGEEDGC